MAEFMSQLCSSLSMSVLPVELWHTSCDAMDVDQAKTLANGID